MNISQLLNAARASICISVNRVSTMKNNAMKLTVFLMTLSVPVAHAASILHAPGGGLTQVDSAEPIGQIFIAENSLIEAGLYFEVMNPSQANDDDILYQLFEGVGNGGSQFASVQFSLADSFEGFYVADFSSVTLIVGNTYSLLASVVGDSPYWGVSKTNDSLAGVGIRAGNLTTTNYALSGSGIGAATGIPIPPALYLFGSGLLGLTGLSRRKKAA